ncbi:hypothetical protein ACVWY0_001243 [Arthrobacter sp. UYNi723]
MQRSHAIAPVAHRKNGPRRCLPHRWSPAPADRGPSPPLAVPQGGWVRTGNDQQAEHPTMKEHSPDPYEVLHLGPAASAREVARAYRALVRAHHPDTRTRTPGTVAAGPECRNCTTSWTPTPFSATRSSGLPTTGSGGGRRRRHKLPRRGRTGARHWATRPVRPCPVHRPGAVGKPREPNRRTAGHRTAGYRPMGSVRAATEPCSTR